MREWYALERMGNCGHCMGIVREARSRALALAGLPCVRQCGRPPWLRHVALRYAAARVGRRVDDLGNASPRPGTHVQAVVQGLRQAIRDAGGGTVPAEPPAIGPKHLPPNDLPEASYELLEVLASVQRVEQSLQMLYGKQPLREFVFPDRGSTVGRLVARLQEQVGRISARWYARYLLLQQNEINTLFLISMQDLTLSVQQLTHATASLASARSPSPATDEHSPTGGVAPTEQSADSDQPRDR